MLQTRFVFAASLLVLWGCGSDESSSAEGHFSARETASPGETATRFLEAIQAEDSAVYRALLTEAARVALVEGEDFAFSGDRVDAFEVGGERVSGEGAEVSVTILRADEEQSADLLLKRERGLWRIHGMSVALGQGAFTLDFEAGNEGLGELAEEFGRKRTEHFETAFADMEAAYAQGGTVQEIAAKRARFEALESIPLAEFQGGWQIDVLANGRSAARLIEEWLAPAGLKLIAGEHSEALATGVELELTQVSRIEAVESVAAAVGLYPVWPDLNSVELDASGAAPVGVRFAVGERLLPSTLAGPFLIEVTELREDAPRPTGLLELTVRALGLDSRAVAYQTEVAEVLLVSELRSSEGAPLVDETVQHWGTPMTQGGYFTYSLRKDLTGLLLSVERIGVIQGQVRLTLPIGIETLELVESSEAQAVGAGRLGLSTWGKDVQFELTGSGDSLAGLAVRMSPRKETGEPLGILLAGTNGLGTTLQASLQCPEAPFAIDVKLCSEEPVRFAFELVNVPLARFAEQPEHLEPLQFDGEAPVEIVLLGGIRRDGAQAEVTLELTNGSSKGVTSAMVEFFYLDVTGEVLGNFPHTLNGEYDFELQAAGVLVPARQSIEKDTFAAFLPEEAVSVRFELREAEFLDGTSWSRER